MTEDNIKVANGLLEKKKAFEKFERALCTKVFCDTRLVVENRLPVANYTFRDIITDRDFIKDVRSLAQRYIENINNEIKLL